MVSTITANQTSNDIHPIKRINATELCIDMLNTTNDLEELIDEVSTIVGNNILFAFYQTYSFQFTNNKCKHKHMFSKHINN